MEVYSYTNVVGLMEAKDIENIPLSAYMNIDV